METSISDKTFVVILKGDIRIWLTEKEFKLFQSLLESGKTFVSFSNRIINLKMIVYAGPRIEVETADRIKNGEWQCRDCGRWHPKGEECGCQGGKY